MRSWKVDYGGARNRSGSLIDIEVRLGEVQGDKCYLIVPNRLFVGDGYLSLEPKIDKGLSVWAEPILKHLDERERRKRVLNIIAATVLSGIVVVWVVAVLPLHVQWQNTFPYMLFGMLAFVFVYFGFDYLLNRLSPVDVTPPQAYSIHILRILNRSNDPGSKFEDAVVKFVRRIDIDLDELQDNLAASRTVKILKELRVLVLKYATAVKEKMEAPAGSMKQTFETAASMFYRFEDVEGLSVFLDAERLNTAAIAERTSLTSPVRPYVNLLRKWPATMVLLLAVFGVVAYALYLYNPFFGILSSFGLAIILAYRGDIGRWLREKFGE